MSKHMLDIYYVKPGSHMPPKPLRRHRAGRYWRVLPAIQLHHTVRPPATRKSEVFTAVMPAKLNSSELRSLRAVKNHGLCCRRLLFSCRKGIAGSTGGYVAGSSAANENQALVEKFVSCSLGLPVVWLINIMLFFWSNMRSGILFQEKGQKDRLSAGFFWGSKGVGGWGRKRIFYDLDCQGPPPQIVPRKFVVKNRK